MHQEQPKKTSEAKEHTEQPKDRRPHRSRSHSHPAEGNPKGRGTKVHQEQPKKTRDAEEHTAQTGEKQEQPKKIKEAEEHTAPTGGSRGSREPKRQSR